MTGKSGIYPRLCLFGNNENVQKKKKKCFFSFFKAMCQCLKSIEIEPVWIPFPRFNTGSGTGTLVSKVEVDQGRWHQLVVTRNRRSAVLSVDNEPHVEGESPHGTDGLNLDTNLFIGGVPPEMKEV